MHLTTHSTIPYIIITGTFYLAILPIVLICNLRIWRWFPPPIRRTISQTEIRYIHTCIHWTLGLVRFVHDFWSTRCFISCTASMSTISYMGHPVQHKGETQWWSTRRQRHFIH